MAAIVKVGPGASLTFAERDGQGQRVLRVESVTPQEVRERGIAHGRAATRAWLAERLAGGRNGLPPIEADFDDATGSVRLVVGGGGGNR